jgi:hypothetical protein
VHLWISVALKHPLYLAWSSYSLFQNSFAQSIFILLATLAFV